MNENNVNIVDEAVSTAENVETTLSKITQEDIDRLTEVVQIESIKNDLQEQTVALHEKQNSLLATIKNYDGDFIDAKLKEHTVEELQILLKDDDVVNSFFVDPETNEPLEFNIKFASKEREIEFKRGLLTYFKATSEAFDSIDAEYAKLEEATAEMNENIANAVNILSDNVLSYIDLLTDKAEAMEDGRDKVKLKDTIRYIRSAYDMSIYTDVLDEHEGVAEKCVAELNNDSAIQRYGERYTKKINRNNVKTSLIQFASGDKIKSFEEQCLVRGDEYIIPDLFVYSLIRFYAMADWNNPDIKRAHASMILVIRKLIAGEFIPEIRAQVVEAIVKYLKKFPTE